MINLDQIWMVFVVFLVVRKIDDPSKRLVFHPENLWFSYPGQNKRLTNCVGCLVDITVEHDTELIKSIRWSR